MTEERKSLVLEKLSSRFGAAILDTHSNFGNDTATVAREKIVEICTFLRDDADLRFSLAVDLTGVDYIDETPRFEVVYHLYSIENKFRVRIKARVPAEDPTIDSVSGIWIGLNWYEREAFDMYGIRFNNHPDLRRILLPETFVGHPLRKDYPKKKRQPTLGREE
jgi:NADH-quinone oxidoreductase subunit C